MLFNLSQKDREQGTFYLSYWFNTPTLWVGNNKSHLILRGSAPG